MKFGDSIYLDYQASTPLDPRVKALMQDDGESYFANPHATQHLLGQQAGQAAEAARAEIENSIGAAAEEVIFTSGATEANNQAIASVLFANRSPRRKILISAIEHKCIKNAAYFYGAKLGYQIAEIPVLASGQIDRQQYEAMLSDDVLLVCIMAVNNEIGVIQDIKTLTKLAHDAGAMMHCDAAQAPEAVDIDVKDWAVDMLSLSAHKIYGPKGIGVLYIRNSLQAELPPFIHGGGQQFGMRSGTLPVALAVAMAMAVKLCKSEASINRSRLATLKQLFIDELTAAGIRFKVNGDKLNSHPGNLSIQFTGYAAMDLLNAIQPQVCASTGSACNSDMVLPSHVLTAIGLTDSEALSTIRFSIGRYSDAEQIKQAVNVLAANLAIRADHRAEAY